MDFRATLEFGVKFLRLMASNLRPANTSKTSQDSSLRRQGPNVALGTGRKGHNSLSHNGSGFDSLWLGEKVRLLTTSIVNPSDIGESSLVSKLLPGHDMRSLWILTSAVCVLRRLVWPWAETLIVDLSPSPVQSPGQSPPPKTCGPVG